jgi:hypothetical protein
VSRALAAIALLFVPALAEACATCIGSPFGDRTYNWPYLLLILVPFVLLTVIGGVMARVSGVSVSALRLRLTQRFHPAARQEETT